MVRWVYAGQSARVLHRLSYEGAFALIIQRDREQITDICFVLSLCVARNRGVRCCLGGLLGPRFSSSSARPPVTIPRYTYHPRRDHLIAF